MFHKATAGSNSSELPGERLRPSSETLTSGPSTVATATGTVATPSASQANATSSKTSSSSTATTSTNNSDRRDEQHPQQPPNKMFQSVNKQQIAATVLHQHYLNYFNSNIPKEGTKSHKTRGSISNSLSQQQYQQQQQQQQAILSNQEFQLPHTSQSISNQRITNTGNRLQHHIHNSRNPLPGTSADIHHIPSTINIPPSSNSYANTNLPINTYHLSRSVHREDTNMSHKFQYHTQQPHTLSQRTHSTGAIAPGYSSADPHQCHRDGLDKMAYNQNYQLDRDSEETTTTTTIKEELENDLEGYKNSELEAISSLERNLPIELSFLIRQQAHCMAKMNYLDRQIRELRENAQIPQHHQHPQQQQIDMNQVSSTSISNRGHTSRALNNLAATTTMTHTKNGNFILSDDSGGEYSRATISDDDELSSLLDQIAKSVRPEKGAASNNDNMLYNNDSQLQHLHHQQQQQQRLSTAYSVIMNNQVQPPQQQLLHQHHHHQQPYAILNPNQLHPHQQAVPIFVMGSPIAVAHPSSISSNILPGVHFQPEPRYNQYYEDFYGKNNSASSTTASTNGPSQRQSFNNRAYRSQQFDQSISAVEQLVSQKEKRQIISQLRSADNWLKMRSSNNNSSSLFNQHQEASLKNTVGKPSTIDIGDGLEQTDVTSGDMKAPASTIKLDSDCVIMKDNEKDGRG